METAFTPWQSLAGGALIGLAAVLLMVVVGRILGATGILAGFLKPADRTDFWWRAAFIAGAACAPPAYLAADGQMPNLQIPVGMPLLLIGGFLVGVGVTVGSGCTSGHGVCGIARLSPRSIAATLTFMASAALTVFVLRHLTGS
ncbi:MAG: YeeE/YedE family protein [Pseudomonadota bacterium]